MEKKTPWWRKVVDFALSGFKAGFGLFRRSAGSGERNQSSAEVIGEVEPGIEVVDTREDAGAMEMSAAGLEESHEAWFEGPQELNEPEEEIALKDTSPQNESVEAAARQELETPPAQEAAPAVLPFEVTEVAKPLPVEAVQEEAQPAEAMAAPAEAAEEDPKEATAAQAAEPAKEAATPVPETGPALNGGGINASSSAS